jgi:hypothetical protein
LLSICEKIASTWLWMVAPDIDGSNTLTFAPSEPPPGSCEPVGVGVGVGVGDVVVGGAPPVWTVTSHSE